VAIDGKSAAITIHTKEATRAKTGFRAADVFPPHLGRRNLLFRGRDETRPDYMKGQLDYVRIYSRVPETGAALPPVPFISPTKAMRRILARLDKDFGNRPHAVRAYQELARTSGYLDRARTWNDRLLLRKYKYELGRDADTIKRTLALRDTYYQLEAQLEIKRFRLYREYLKTPEAVRMQKQRARIQDEISAAEKGLREAIAAFRKQYDKTKRDEPTKPDVPPQNPEWKVYLQKLAKAKASIAKATEDEKTLRRKLREMEEEARAKIKEPREVMATQIAALKEQVAQSEKELSKETGPVAKVFGPVIAEIQARVTALNAKPARTAEEKKALRDAQSDLRDLAQRRRNVLLLHRERKLPPTGLLYRDLELVAVRAKLQHLERAAEALLTDLLMADAEYMATKVLLIRAQADRRLKLPRPPVGSGASPPPRSFDEALRQLPAWKKRDALRASLREAADPKASFEAYAREKLGDFPVKVAAAGNAWNKACAENAEAVNPDEFRFVGDTSYQRRFYSISDRVSPAIADRLAGPSAPDDLAQLKTAANWQKRWYTSTSDWDTKHRQEKDYENRNSRIKRWLKRIKPYRYGDGVNGSGK